MHESPEERCQWNSSAGDSGCVLRTARHATEMEQSQRVGTAGRMGYLNIVFQG